MRRVLPCLLALLLATTACGDDASPTEAGDPGDGSSTSTTTTAPVGLDTPEGQLADARARWADHGPKSYRLTTAELCFCPRSEWVDTVVDGTVIEHRAVGEDVFNDPGPHTMTTLFDEIAAAIADGYETLEVDYSPDTGAVQRYWVDVDEMIADEEYGVEVISLAPYDPDGSDVVPTAQALTVDHGCGYGFAKGNVDQTLSLVISWDGGASEGPDLSSPIDLATSTEWTATFSAGHDLFANWCDDVMEPGEPTPDITHTWTVVGGMLSVDGPVDDLGSCGSNQVTALLTGAVAKTTADGVNALDDVATTDLRLDDIALANAAWGCFAG